MGKLDKRWLSLLILILLMAVGLPYLSLNEAASTATVENKVDVQSMSIALVNEDEGATFNGETLTFGEAFVRSLDNNDEHNWFVVSRGVAESGLNRNTYDMMIVIPNDFSEKALSIETETPEQVVLNYRINATDDEHVRAEAENTASTILNEFNRRIIDVYFTSIIGNLQEAQDNIKEIIDKQVQYTSTYNQEINNPLSNYTDQFGMIKNNTQVSRDGFSGLEELLQNFEERLAENAEQSATHLSELDNFASTKDANHSELLRFSDSLLQYNSLINHADANHSMDQLQQANALINFQLAQLDDEEHGMNIVTELDMLRNHINQMINRVDNINNHLVERLDLLNEDVEESITTILQDVLQASEEQEEFLQNLFVTQDGVLRGTINEQILQLPSWNESEFENIGLPETTVSEIQKVITIAKGYNNDPEFDYVASKIQRDESLAQYIDRLRNHLTTKGMTITDKVWLPENEKEGQEFTLQIPEAYELIKLELTFPNEATKDYTEGFKENNKLVLGANQEGEFQIELALRLKDEESEIDVFNPVRINWEMHHQYVEEEEIDKPSQYSTAKPSRVLVASSSVDNVEEETDSDSLDEEVTDSTKLNNDESNAEEDSQNTVIEEIDQAEDSVEDSNGKGLSRNVKVSNDINQDSENPNETIERVKIFNNRVSHQIAEPIDKLDNATSSLIRMVTNTISPYQKLYATFNNYFGSSILSMNKEKLKREIEENGLTSLALEEGERSLYYFFNHTDIEEIITEDMVNAIITRVYDEIEEPLSLFQENVAQFRDVSKRLTDEQLRRITEELLETRTGAKHLNDNLEQVLTSVENWRDESMSLLENHGVVEANDGEEQAAFMALTNDFQPLLNASQSIRDQAEGNLASASTVYETLDAIDDQADSIEQSGVSLVRQANTLSTNMTEKLVEDQAFADNFTEVLANSRIGERQNENLYNFLSNPVKTSNEGTITSGDNFTPYYLVLTMFIVVLFTAYVISTLQQKQTEENQFIQDKSLMALNTPLTLIITGIGVVEGIAISLISSSLLDISGGSMLLWTVLISALMAAMLLIATYLLRQLKMFGMFLLLIIFSIYLFSASTFGNEGLAYLRGISPLHYVENILLQAVQGSGSYLVGIFVIIGLILIGVLANLLVPNRGEKGDLEDEGSKAAS